MIVIDFTYPPQLLTATRARYIAEVTELFAPEPVDEREQQAREADTIREWLDDADTTVNLPPAQQAALAYGDAVDLDEWQPLEHVPDDPAEMYKPGWVFNTRRAAIKNAYEKKLHKDYNALWTKGT